MASWGSARIWQKAGKGSLKPGRPIWSKVGDPIDLVPAAGGVADLATLRALTVEVMDALTALVEDLRARYPGRWADDG
jgi:hypothetical protein